MFYRVYPCSSVVPMCFFVDLSSHKNTQHPRTTNTPRRLICLLAIEIYLDIVSWNLELVWLLFLGYWNLFVSWLLVILSQEEHHGRH